MHSSRPGFRASSWSTLVPTGTPGTPRAGLVYVLHVVYPGVLREVALGSLPSAPVDTLARLVPWPVKLGLIHPLIGTPRHAPCVTP